MIVSEFATLNMLRHMPSSEVVAEYGPLAEEIFSNAHHEACALPVVIATRNEELDLPAALASLARSEFPVIPIVADYPLGDKTGEYAKSMGAHLVSTATAGKIGALQLGVKYARDELGKKKMLFMDGDVLTPKTWAGSMHEQMADQEEGIAVFGSVLIAHGKSKLTDALRSVRCVLKSVKAMRYGAEPLITGQNMAINFGDNAAAWSAYMEMDPALFVGDDMAIHDQLKATEMHISAHVSLGSLVLSRGDRFSSIGELLAERKNRWSTKTAFYKQQYGENVVVYDQLR